MEYHRKITRAKIKAPFGFAITVEPHYNGTEGTDCIFALLPKSGVAIWAISVKKKQKKAEEKNIFSSYY